MASSSYKKPRHKTDKSPDVTLSKLLSYVCRHGAEKLGITVYDGGYVNVDDILDSRDARKNGFTQDDVRRVVENCPKQRFTLRHTSSGEVLQIRANQGHSMEVEGLELIPIISSDGVTMAIHGTYYKAWDSIKKEGLSRMARTHIHLAPGLPGDSGVISGMRASCQVLVYVNVRKAIEDGIEFVRSSNNVILSTGNKDGFILPKYFDKVTDFRSGELLSF